MFVGFDPEDGAPLYDTKEAAIERARQMIQWGDDPEAKIMLRRSWIPRWLARFVRGTQFDWIGYFEAPLK